MDKVNTAEKAKKLINDTLSEIRGEVKTTSNWFYGTAGSAENAGIINGYEDNTFRRNVTIPKDQIVSVLARVLKNEMGYYDVADVEKTLSEYGDREAIAQWAEKDVALATDANMV